MKIKHILLIISLFVVTTFTVGCNQINDVIDKTTTIKDTAEYAVKTGPVITEASLALTDLTLLAESMQSGIVQDNWKEQLTADLEILQQASKDIQNIEPPETYEDVHKELEQAGENIDLAVDIYNNELKTANTIEEIDEQKLVKVTEYIEQAIIHFDNASVELQEISNNFSR